MPRVPRASIIVGLGTMALAMHSSAFTTIVPYIVAQSHLSISSVQWILVSYTLVLSCCLVTSGRIADAIGLRSVYRCGLLIMIFSSLVLLAAHSIASLLLLRGLEGLGAAMVSGTSLGLLKANSNATGQLQSIACQSIMTNAGLAAGPLLSLLLIPHVHWSAVFISNVAFCSLAFLLGSKLVNRSQGGASNFSFSSSELVLPVLLIAPVAIALNTQNERGISWIILAGAVLTVLLFVTLLPRKVATLRPLLGVYRGSRGFIVTEFFAYVCASGTAFVAPLYLILVLRVGPLWAGCILSMQYIARGVAAIFAVPAASRLGSHNTRAWGTIIIALPLFVIAEVPHSTPTLVSMALTTIGAGTGLFATVNSAALMESVSGSRCGTATGILATARNLGMSFGVITAATLWRSKMLDGTGVNGMSTVALTLSFAAILNIATITRGFRCKARSTNSKLQEAI